MTGVKEFLDGPHGRLAYRQRAGEDAGRPGIVWLGGYRSDMLGTKAEHLDQWAQANRRSYLRFDYSGHGESEGRFEDGSIGDWAADALAIIDAKTQGSQILIGSSMGGWIAALTALKLPDKAAAIIFIAPAPDFTEKLMWPSFTAAQQETLMQDGKLELPSDYSDEPDLYTRKLIEDGRNHLIMDGPVAIRCPVRILQGMKDDAVPYIHALHFAALLESDDVEILLTPGGDHRLSTPPDLERLTRTLDRL
ncbi:alpha/beta hydrolase [Marinicaulis aureus]|uniref:Palmitoyl-protein thioesterase ABHD10, mitochondrial n=1 Tax=Hyphococcus aureus TaxID=2666033 RepID=A0ABW1KVM3_9PROT